MGWTPGGGGASKRYRDTSTNNTSGETFLRLKESGDSATFALLMPPFETYFGISSFKDKDGNDKPSSVVNYPVLVEGTDSACMWGAGRAGEKAVAEKIRALAKKAAKPREPQAEHYDQAEADLYGHWLEVTRVGSGPTTTYTFELQGEFTGRDDALDSCASLLDTLVARAGESADAAEADGFGSVAQRIRAKLAHYDASEPAAVDDDDDLF
jgi:hypothetical protein